MTTTEEQPEQKSSGAVIWMLTIALVIFAIGLSVNPAPNNDLFWQLRTGQAIVAQHHPPHADSYSWTRAGTPWVAHEWLTFAIMWLCYQALGFAGLWLFLAVIVAALWAGHFRIMLRETGAPLTAVLLSTVTAILCVPFYQPRPQLFTYVFMLITVAQVTAARKTGASDAIKKRLWLLVPMFVVWANLHAGVLIGVGLVGMFAAGDFVTLLIKRQADKNRPLKDAPTDDAASSMKLCLTLGLVAVAGFMATLVTPYSYHVYENFAATIGNSTAMSIVGEWQSVDFHGDFGHQVEIFLFVMAGALLFTRLRLDGTEIAILTILIHQALTTNRNVPLLGLVGSILIARHLQSALTRLTQRTSPQRSPSMEEEDGSDALFGPRPSPTFALLILVALSFGSFARASSTVREAGPPSGPMLTRLGLAAVRYDTYPQRACDFINRENFPTTMRMYDIYGAGGFLIWRIPRHPVFIDGRADIYFGPILEESNKLRTLSYRWQDILKARGVDMIVAAAPEKQSRMFMASPDWALVYADRADFDKSYDDYARQDNTLVFVKRDPQYAELIARCRRECPAFQSADMAKLEPYPATH